MKFSQVTMKQALIGVALCLPFLITVFLLSNYTSFTAKQASLVSAIVWAALYIGGIHLVQKKKKKQEKEDDL